MTSRAWGCLIGIVVILAATIGGGVYLLRPLPPPIPAKPIRIDAGLVQGLNENGLTIYRGIPFAAPPVGELRWRAPQPLAPWTGTLKATAFKPACMQSGATVPGMDAETASEDCLYLNIWTPAKSASEKRAVMVYLYGGDFRNGSGSARLYWGDQLAKKGVVAVTFNYRVGVFGALAHPELSTESGHSASGNEMLLDSISALQWVKRNIAAFGGDADNVTIFGQSAGAYLVSDLIVSPLASGLFHRAIGQSGADMGMAGSYGDYPLLAQAEQTGAAFSSSLGANSLSELRAMSADKIAAEDQQNAAALNKDADRPNVDGYVLPRDAYTLTAAGHGANIDLLVGIDADEGASQIAAPLSPADYIAEIGVHYDEFADRFLALYPAHSNAEAAQSQAHLATADAAWRTFTWARLHANANHAKTFAFVFSRVPPFDPFLSLKAAGHGAELGYVFGYPPGSAFYLLEAPWKAWRDARIADEMQTYWTNFAKTGDPNGAGVPPWSAFTPVGENSLDIGGTDTMRALPNKSDRALMDTYWAARRKQVN